MPLGAQSRGDGFAERGPPLTTRRAVLRAVLPHDRGGRFQAHADGATLVDKGALGGNSFDDILDGQNQRRPATLERSLSSCYKFRFKRL
jgi:hypothetical protein